MFHEISDFYYSQWYPCYFFLPKFELSKVFSGSKLVLTSIFALNVWLTTEIILNFLKIRYLDVSAVWAYLISSYWVV